MGYVGIKLGHITIIENNRGSDSIASAFSVDFITFH